jgi:hypothetical protein
MRWFVLGGALTTLAAAWFLAAYPLTAPLPPDALDCEEYGCGMFHFRRPA